MTAFPMWPAISLECLVLLCGCAVGPNYKRPMVDSPGNFRSAPALVTTNSIADLPWWDVYQDQTLKSLIHVALTNNYDVRIAATRVEQARAISAEARSAVFSVDRLPGRHRQRAQRISGDSHSQWGHHHRCGFDHVERSLGD